MIPFFSLFGYEFTSTGMLLALIAFVVGFIIGEGLKRSMRIVLVLLACLGFGAVFIVAIGALNLFTPNLIQGVTAIWTIVDPTLWLKELLSFAGASTVFGALVLGAIIGVWKG